MTTTLIPPTREGSPCGCGHDLCDDPVGLERTRFFPKQLVSPEDLTQDQRYFREKHRRHNRMLHGWGVVCGVNVREATDEQGNPIPYTACVTTGYVLGPYGDEIVVDRNVPFDVRRAADDVRDGCPPPVDPWCSPVRVDRDPEKTIYLAIRYDEYPARPVQAESGCGCGDEADCEYSRIVDGFALGILDELPEAYEEPFDSGRGPGESAVPRAQRDTVGEDQTVRCTPLLRRMGRPCPPCPTSPWVVLADLKVGAGGAFTELDQWEHRRFVASAGHYGFFCRGRRGAEVSGGLIMLDDSTRKLVVDLVGRQFRSEAEKLESGEQALEIPAAQIRGVSVSGALETLVGTQTVGELAEIDQDRFVKEATEKGVSEAAAKSVLERAQLIRRAVGG